jgi:hypothetical protein
LEKQSKIDYDNLLIKHNKIMNLVNELHRDIVDGMGIDRIEEKIILMRS